MEKRAILAIILSAVILFIWYAINPPKPSQKTKIESVKEKGMITKKERELPVKQKILPLLEEQQKKVKKIMVETKTSRIVLSSQGASVVSWEIKEQYKEKWEDMDLVIEQEPQLSTFPEVIYEVDKDNLILTENNKEATVKFQYISKQGLFVSKIYTFCYDGYTFGLDIKFENRVNETIKSSLSLNWGPGTGIDKDIFQESKKSMRAVMFKEGSFNKKIKPGSYQGAITWIGIDNRYFLVALIPKEAKLYTTLIAERDNLPLINLSKDISLTAGQSENIALNIYGGPKKYSYMRNMGKYLEKTCNFGVFSGLARLMLKILDFFYNLTNNYGWAIVLLTLVVQIPLFPLTAKSFKSTMAMQQLQPQMTELRQKYKDDPRRVNVEIMNLYKQNKVNPFGGCLPMLLQMPIFWALFTTLRNAVELRHAPFIFWMKDLSIPDGRGVNTAFRFPGEGLPLIGNSLNILVILMGAFMFLQQKISSPASAQSKMVLFMPILFTVMFWNFPSGLVLYWLTNSIITIIGQYAITKRS